MVTKALMFIEVGPDYARKLRRSPHVQNRLQTLSTEHGVPTDEMAFVIFQGQHYIRVTIDTTIHAVHYCPVWE